MLSPADSAALLEGLSIALLALEPASGRAEALQPLPPWLRALGSPCDLLTHVAEPDRAMAREAVATVAASGVARSLECGLEVGGARLVVHGVLTKPAEGAHLLLALQDVTVARYEARQWREVESWLVTLGETLPFDFWIQDREGRFLLQNPASVRRLGIALGKQVGELALGDEDRRSLEAGFLEVMGGRSVSEEVNVVVDGATATRARTLSPLFDEGAVVGVLGVDIDITPLKQSETRLRRSLEALEATQDALVRRKQLAALGEMAAVVAHEVRNPLGSIANVVSLLERGLVSGEEERELWRVISDETRRLDLLVVNLLDFVRPLALTLSPRPLEPLITAALQQTLFSENVGQRVRTSVVGTAPPVPVDASQLEVALTNLFRNAVQAMKGEGSLEVELSTEEHRHVRWARLVIRDTGPGVPPEVQRRLFEPFVTTRARGHGLGLAIVRRVIDQHQGEVAFEPATGGGTACVIRLPLESPPT